MFDEQITSGRVVDANGRNLKMMFGLMVVVILVGGFFTVERYSAKEAPVEAQAESQPQASTMFEDSPALTVEQQEQFRSLFKEKLQKFEQRFAAKLSNPGLEVWDGEGLANVLQIKQQALTAFGQKRYLEALEIFGGAPKLAERLVEQWQQQYTRLFAEAKSHFEQQNMSQAAELLNETLSVKPDFADALALKARLEVYPKVAELLAKAKVANIEQKFEQEAEFLRQVISLDPARSELNSRIAAIKQSIKAQQFSYEINRGLRYIDQGNVSAAQAAYQAAKQIDASGNELLLLANKIAQSQKTSALNRAVVEVELLVFEDNWSEAFSQTNQLLKRFKDHGYFRQTNQLAKQLLSLDRQLERHLASPHRFSDKKINKLLKRWLKDNRELAKSSAKLSEKMQQLKLQLEVHQLPVPVVVMSDGKTEVLVVGVGRVGRVEQYSLKLPPGNYVFEGRRKGYRSTRVKVEVSPSIVNQQVSVICHEQI